MTTKATIFLTFCTLGILSAEVAPVPADHAAKMKAGLALFEAKIRPALNEHCLKCHGGEKTRAGFDLASRDALLKGGESGLAVDFAKPNESLFMVLLNHEEEPFMPAKQPKLDSQLLSEFSRWIELGAPYSKPLVEKSDGAKKPMVVTNQDREFWSFKPLHVIEPAAVPGAATPIDRFVGAAQEKHGLKPNPEADRRTLARRASLDLTGMPPTPEEMNTFLADTSPDAWGKLLDRLLNSTGYGERWARHWMDVARFAESDGFEHDYSRPNAWHYRDFLIQAFNKDLPYDQFVSWQLAGDELAPNEPLANMATGFLGAGVFPTQLTEVEFEPARYEELDDMTGTTGVAFLGLSVGCARCHDHKFDPIPALDYYRMVATFATTIKTEKQIDFDPAGYQQKLAPWEKTRAEHQAALTAYENAALEAKFQAWLASKPTPPALGNWRVLELTSATSSGKTTLVKQPDNSYLATGAKPPKDDYLLKTNVSSAGLSALRIEALTHDSLPKKGPGRASNGNFSLSNLVVEARPVGKPDAAPTPVKLVSARATHEQDKSNLSAAASFDANPDGSGWAVDGGGVGKDQAAVYGFEKPLGANLEVTVRMRFHVNTEHSIGRVRLAMAPRADLDFEIGKGVAPVLADAFDALKSGAAFTAPQRAALKTWFAPQDAEWAKLNQSLQAHLTAQPKPDVQTVMICSEGVKPLKHHADGRGYPHFYPEVSYLLRGDVKQKQEVVGQGFLQVLSPDGVKPEHWKQTPAAGATSSFRRASLAKWMTDTEEGAGQLLARVIVNRMWQHHFGRGIVSTPNDFGFQGSRPTHPELLDWLANDLISNGWKLKRLHKLMMMSATYRQNTDYVAEKAKLDITNHYLWRFQPRRLEGEAIRDSLLAVSGLLDPKMYGAGTLDPNMRRRSVYFTVKRSQLPTVMQVFDWPEHLVSIGERPSTTVAPQALYFMNSPQARQYADGLAKRAAAMGSEPVSGVYQLAFNRAPSADESAVAKQFLAAQTAQYNSPDAPQRALVDYCQAVLSSNEFLYLP